MIRRSGKLITTNIGFLLVSPECLEGLDFSAMFGVAEKSKVQKKTVYQARSAIILKILGGHSLSIL